MYNARAQCTGDVTDSVHFTAQCISEYTYSGHCSAVYLIHTRCVSSMGFAQSLHPWGAKCAASASSAHVECTTRAPRATGVHFSAETLLQSAIFPYRNTLLEQK